MQKANLRGTGIDYYCFPTRTGDISAFSELERYTDITEKAYYEKALKEVMKAKEIGKLLLFDLKNQNFINENGEKVDITGKLIFPRSTISQSNILIENIQKEKGKSITSKHDWRMFENWYKHITTRRSYEITTMKLLQENYDYYESKFGHILFVKSLNKKFSGMVIILELSHDKKILIDSYYHNLQDSITIPETPIIVYRWIDALKDRLGKRQWRAFVVNNELISLSRASDKLVPVEEYVYQKVQTKIRNWKKLMPTSYVVDFFEYQEGKKTIFDVVEFYPIISARTFANNEIIF